MLAMLSSPPVLMGVGPGVGIGAPLWFLLQGQGTCSQISPRGELLRAPEPGAQAG
ncbi:hypothetical protein P7K49_032515, partial [Saguinus oedipus]